MNPSEIIPNLFIGNINDSLTFDGMVITVVGNDNESDKKETYSRNATYIPILKNLPTEEIAQKIKLDACAEAIDTLLATGKKVLIHCYVGMERSPFAVAYYLQTKKGMTYNEAYDLITSKRPLVQKRSYRIV